MTSHFISCFGHPNFLNSLSYDRDYDDDVCDDDVCDVHQPADYCSGRFIHSRCPCFSVTIW